MRHLTEKQRYVISALHKRGISQKEIAKEVGVHKSTISRELKRNAGKRGGYRADRAQALADERKERFKRARRFTPQIEKLCRNYIEEEQWSPEEIVGYCKANGIEMVSIERIYQFIRTDKRNGGTLFTHLRHRLKHRKRAVSRQDKAGIKDRVSIEQRSEKANNREEFGHWEGDLIEGKNHKGFILVVTERVSKQMMMTYLPKGKNAKAMAQAIIALLLPYKEMVLSITVDNGTEFAEHKKVSKALNCQIYFTHPYSSWEKGQVENTNGLIRQYYPKKEIIDEFNTKNIKQIQYKINRRPRKNLEFKRPVDIFYKFVNDEVAFAG